MGEDEEKPNMLTKQENWVRKICRQKMVRSLNRDCEVLTLVLFLPLKMLLNIVHQKNTVCIWQVTTINEKTTTIVMRSGSPDLLGHMVVHILGIYNNKTIFHRANLVVVSFWKHHYGIIQSKNNYSHISMQITISIK